jgi:hypothetical protein
MEDSLSGLVEETEFKRKKEERKKDWVGRAAFV